MNSRLVSKKVTVNDYERRFDGLALFFAEKKQASEANVKVVKDFIQSHYLRQK